MPAEELNLDTNFDIDLIDVDLNNPFEVENTGIKSKTKSKTENIIFRNLKEKLKQEVKEKLDHLIKPINAAIIKNYIPEQNETAFFLMNGNCQFVDYISEFVKAIKRVDEIYLTTLSLNEHTFNSLDLILPNLQKHILVSSYFLATDKNGTLEKMKDKNRLEKYEIGFFRNHTKMVLIRSGKNFFVFTGSANLRSSGTIEQFCIFNQREIYNFNKAWIQFLIDKYNFNKKYTEIKNTGQASFYFMEDINF